MNVIVDTCIWSLGLRHKKFDPSIKSTLQILIDQSRVQMLGPIRQEILSGVALPVQFNKLKLYLESFPDLPLISKDYEHAAEIYNHCRSKGIQGSHIDFLICATSIHHNMAIYTYDQDFKLYAEYVPIKLFMPDLS